MEEVTKIVNDIKAKKISPLYFFMGNEPYYIDKLSEFIQQNILTPDEKEFNQMVLYGRDVSIEDIVSHAKRYPMMAEKQVIIVKEAQDLARTIEKLESYATNPQPTTVLVFCYKYGTLDKRKKVAKLIAKNGVLFESVKLKEYQVGDWIKKVLAGKGYTIDAKASSMLVEFLGNDLAKINNELTKLQVVVPKGVTITANDIEKNIGFSKDFNNFELRNAIGSRDEAKAYQIIDYFKNNPKDNPIVVTTSMVFSFFVQIMQYHGLNDKSAANVMKALKLSNAYFIKDYEIAARNYPMKKVSQVIATIRNIDLKSKGVDANSMPQGELLKEMLIKIFN